MTCLPPGQTGHGRLEPWKLLPDSVHICNWEALTSDLLGSKSVAGILWEEEHVSILYAVCWNK